jgi:hypothetical protein
MNRRSLLKGTLGAAGALVGALAVRTGVDGRASVRDGVQGRQVDALMSLATQGTSHYATPVDGSRTFVAGPFSDTAVMLERPWRIVNDPSYVNYDPACLYGAPGASDIFPEYDRAFPIERAATPDGWWAYTVRNVATNASAGFHDPYLTYASNDIADQEITARALYVEHVAHLRGAEMTLVTGPDPTTYVNVAFRTDGTVIVLPPGAPLLSPESVDRWMGIPRAEFPESDPKHGAVTIFDLASNLLPPDEWTVPMIRAHYLYALGQRTPDVPVDGNHLSMRFMPKALSTVMPTLNGEEVRHVTESYDGPDGWLVQVVTDDTGAVAVFGDSLRSRILTGTVEHWMDGVAVSPGTYTAPLLRSEAESRMIAPLQIVPGTSVTRNIYRQATPFTTEQMLQLRDAHRALPNVFSAVIATGPKEGGMYTVRVICEIGGLATAPLLR